MSARFLEGFDSVRNTLHSRQRGCAVGECAQQKKERDRFGVKRFHVRRVNHHAKRAAQVFEKTNRHGQHRHAEEKISGRGKCVA